MSSPNTSVAEEMITMVVRMDMIEISPGLARVERME